VIKNSLIKNSGKCKERHERGYLNGFQGSMVVKFTEKILRFPVNFPVNGNIIEMSWQ